MNIKLIFLIILLLCTLSLSGASLYIINTDQRFKFVITFELVLLISAIFLVKVFNLREHIDIHMLSLLYIWLILALGIVLMETITHATTNDDIIVSTKMINTGVFTILAVSTVITLIAADIYLYF